jgi:hypothetical protein
VSDRQFQPHTSRTLRVLLVVAGALSLGLGILGIFLPVLPTTPFLLLSAACWLQSSRRLYDWLLNTRFPGHYIRDWRAGRGLPRALKWNILALLVVTIGISGVFFVEALWARILLGVVLVAVGTHIVRLPTRRSDSPPSSSETVEPTED